MLGRYYCFGIPCYLLMVAIVLSRYHMISIHAQEECLWLSIFLCTLTMETPLFIGLLSLESSYVLFDGLFLILPCCRLSDHMKSLLTNIRSYYILLWIDS